MCPEARIFRFIVRMSPYDAGAKSGYRLCTPHSESAAVRRLVKSRFFVDKLVSDEHSKVPDGGEAIVEAQQH